MTRAQLTAVYPLNKAYSKTHVNEAVAKQPKCFPIASQVPLPEQEGPSAGSLATFELMSSKDVAYHLTVYDWELFNCVHEVRGQVTDGEAHSRADDPLARRAGESSA